MTHTSAPRTSGHDQPLDPLDQFFAARATGTAVLKHVFRRALSVEQLMDLGCLKPEAIALRSAAYRFFGPARFRKRRNQVVNALTEASIPLPALLRIDYHLAKTKAEPTDKLTPVELLEKIATTVSGSVTDIDSQAAAIVRKHNKAIDEAKRARLAEENREPEPPRGNVFGVTEPDAAGNSRIIVENEASVTSELDAILHDAARKLMRDDPTLTLAQAKNLTLLERARSALTGNTTGTGLCPSCQKNPASPGQSPIVPVVLMPVTGYAKAVAGQHGLEEFGSTDGTTYTLSDIARRGLADERYILFVTPAGEPLQILHTRPENIDPDHVSKPSGTHQALSRRDAALEATFTAMPGELNTGTTRTANAKQRLAAQLMTLICPWPGCTAPARECQTHHLVAVSQGGQTTIDNLSPLCKRDNSRNDDDRSRPLNGHLIHKDWEIYYQPPDKSPPIPNRHPMSALTSTALAKKHRAFDINRIDQLHNFSPETEVPPPVQEKPPDLPPPSESELEEEEAEDFGHRHSRRWSSPFPSYENDEDFDPDTGGPRWDLDQPPDPPF